MSKKKVEIKDILGKVRRVSPELAKHIEEKLEDGLDEHCTHLTVQITGKDAFRWFLATCNNQSPAEADRVIADMLVKKGVFLFRVGQPIRTAPLFDR